MPRHPWLTMEDAGELGLCQHSSTDEEVQRILCAVLNVQGFMST